MEKKANKPFHYGFALAKIFMCFEVVLCHFWYEQEYSILLQPFKEIGSSAVPVFALISFCLAAPAFLNPEPGLIRRRMLRLCRPHVIWALIYWVIYWLLGCAGGLDQLVWQIFTGHSERLNPTMWFQTVMIAISALLFLAGLRLKGRKMLVFTAALGAGALLLQYTGLNHAIFWGLRYELRYPLGRLIEVLPYAPLGLILADQSILSRFRARPRAALSAACVMLAVSFIGVIPDPSGFGYGGLNLMLRATAIIMLVHLLPLNYAPDRVKRLIRWASGYTMGVYCIHRMTERLMYFSGLSRVLSWIHIAGDSFAFSVIVYVLSFGLCVLIARIPRRWCRQLVE